MQEQKQLYDQDIHHKIMAVKINDEHYRYGMSEEELYGVVRGIWRASQKKAMEVDYVFGVYKSIIVAVYKPSRWFVCKDASNRLPRKDIVLTERNQNRIFFEDDNFEKGIVDENQMFYQGKSIESLSINSKGQNPVMYINPK